MIGQESVARSLEPVATGSHAGHLCVSRSQRPERMQVLRTTDYGLLAISACRSWRGGRGGVRAKRLCREWCRVDGPTRRRARSPEAAWAYGRGMESEHLLGLLLPPTQAALLRPSRERPVGLRTSSE